MICPGKTCGAMAKDHTERFGMKSRIKAVRSLWHLSYRKPARNPETACSQTKGAEKAGALPIAKGI